MSGMYFFIFASCEPLTVLPTLIGQLGLGRKNLQLIQAMSTPARFTRLHMKPNTKWVSYFGGRVLRFILLVIAQLKYK